tara:strand:- start:102 stop:611 length:510 start_codon:yes stop_codon:yes gene_type:complete
MNASVGADIESTCRKCGDVWHVVVAMVDGDIAKVECKECKGTHKYKEPGSETTTAKSKKAAKPKKKPLTAAEKKAAAAAKPKTHATVEPDLSKPTRPYKFSDTFESGERIDHVKFGVGVVEDVLDGGKIEVYFPEGRRVLALKKSTPKLASLKEERPAWLDHLKSAKAE